MTAGRPPRTAVVVGAGIGGLTAAVALHQRGWDVRVLERAPVLSAVGAGIAVAPNGLRALDAVHLGRDVRRHAATPGPGGYRDPDGRWLLRQDLGAVSSALGDPFVVLRRADLLAAIVDRLPPSALQLGTEVRGVDAGSRTRRAVVTTDAGTYEADLVVAADGVHSGLRRALVPGHPGTRYAGYVAWRLLPRADADLARDGQFETWGRGRRFSALSMAGDAVYCWATVSLPAGRVGLPAGDPRDELAAIFAGWHAPIPALIDATPADRVLRHEVVELAAPLPALHVGRVAFVGDAGHAMTPDLGQGGCLALEDAVTLARLVDRPPGDEGGHDGGLEDALARYTAVRLPRVTRLARLSRRVARVGQASGPLATGLRRAALRSAGALPASVTTRGLESVVGWRPDGSG